MTHKPSPVVVLTSTERLSLAGKIVRGLAKLPEDVQRNVLQVVGSDPVLGDALYHLEGHLRGLTVEERSAVVSVTRTLVGSEADSLYDGKVK